MDIVAKQGIADAADLLQFLTELKEAGHDLSTIYLLNKDGDNATEVALLKTRLTDGSTVNDLRFYFEQS